MVASGLQIEDRKLASGSMVEVEERRLKVERTWSVLICPSEQPSPEQALPPEGITFYRVVCCCDRFRAACTSAASLLSLSMTFPGKMLR